MGEGYQREFVIEIVESAGLILAPNTFVKRN
jgi:hypothetical protein